MIIEGRKTQTRRVCKLNEVLIGFKPGTHYAHCVAIANLVTPPGADIPLTKLRLKWQRGRTYAVQPGRGKPAVARIRITDIRQERLQDISEDDARAEGYQPAPTVIAGLVPGMPLAWYEQVWRRINKRKGTRWADNPLVWVLTFEAVR